MDTETEIARMLNHYFGTLARAVGQRWGAANRADMQRLAALLATPTGET